MKKIGIVLTSLLIILVTGCGDGAKKVETKEMNNYQLDLRIYGDQARDSVRVNVNNDDLYISRNTADKKKEEFYVIAGQKYAKKDSAFVATDDVDYSNAKEYLAKAKNQKWKSVENEKIGEKEYKVYTFTIKTSEVKSLLGNLDITMPTTKTIDGKVYVDSNNVVYKVIYALGENNKIDATYFRIGNIDPIELPTYVEEEDERTSGRDLDRRNR